MISYQSSSKSARARGPMIKIQQREYRVRESVHGSHVAATVISTNTHTHPYAQRARHTHIANAASISVDTQQESKGNRLTVASVMLTNEYDGWYRRAERLKALAFFLFVYGLCVCAERHG